MSDVNVGVVDSRFLPACTGHRHRVSRIRPTPLRALVLGVSAGVIGTAAMTVHHEIAARLQRTSSSSNDELPRDQQERDPWESAPAPAKVGKRLLEGVFHHQIGPDKIGVVTNAMHWLYGTSWGALYGLIGGTIDVNAALAGPLFGAGVWAASYVELVPMGIYEPPWKYPIGTLANDLAYHLTFGTGVATAYAMLERRTSATM